MTPGRTPLPQPRPDGREPVLVSVVIPTYNAVATLGAQLDALDAQDYQGPVEVVVADNGSTDGLIGFLAGRRGRLPVRRVDAGDRKGVSHARNVGTREARGDLVLICDADDVVAPGWVRALVSAARGADVAGGPLDPSLINKDGAPAWRFPHPADRLPVKLRFLPYAHGCNVAVWRDVITSLGGWDESYGPGGEDVDFAWRVQLAGGRLVNVPDAVVHYRHRSSLRGLARQMAGYAEADVLLYRRFRADGAHRRPTTAALRDVWWLASRLPLLRRPHVRGLWMNRAGQLRGRVRGSWRYRVYYP